MRIKSGHIPFVISVFVMFILGSCSTEKDAALNVGYHNMTARYNGYHNARVLMDETLESYRESTVEDYNKLLPLDLYPTKEEVPLIQEKYETAFEKCEKVIFRHSMPNAEASKNKSVEHCRWIDDNWFVIGVIHYTRHEYDKAEEIFKFLQESPLYADQERVHEARIWLAKTYIAKKDFAEAKRYLVMSDQRLESAENSKKEKKEKESKLQKQRRKKREKKDKENGVKKPVPFPKDLKDDLELAHAEFYIAKGEYKKAIEHLETGIELTKKKKKKARYQFVLAQLYQELGNGDKASECFSQVVKSPAPYEMRFQAQINKALSATGGSELLRKELAKMIKDPKNMEYRDQIYFALAEIDMKEGQVDQAKFNYSQSAFFSIKNNRQKGVSYLKLGDIHFEEKDYLSAQKYYDSCVQVLPEEYEDYEKVKAKAEGLSGLVVHYETYIHEDSVQKKAQMSPDQLDKYLEETLKQILAEEERKKEEEARKLIAQQNRIKNSGATTGSGSKWYFYNQKVSGSGFNDFRALWGQRVLEDNWRRTNKTSYSTDDPDDPDYNDSLVVDQPSDSLTVDILRAGLPLTPEAMDTSNNRLMNSLYMLGIIYKETLKEEKEAINYFDKLVNRGVEHPRVLPALYQLYLISSKKNSPQASGYKDQILKKYPDSEIAEILKDPDYLKKKQEKEREELNAYSKTLENYNYRRYGEVLSTCNQVIAYDSANQYINKYYLLKAFAIGKTDPGNKTAIRSPLESLYAKSPSSEEGIEAKKYLDLLSQGNQIVKPDTTSAPKSPYTYDENLEHYFVIVFPNDAGNINATKIQLANFNKDFYKSKGLQTTTAVMGAENQVLIIRSFANQSDALDYKAGFNSTSARQTLGRIPQQFDHFLINSANFTILFNSMDIKSYQAFYKEKYP
ncbi:MAG: tetratricopeptide repeat protein [Crocinitomicaceae bacterium]